MRGCFFRYKKALWRKWTKLYFSRNSEENSTRWLKLLRCLPFLPGNSIQNAFFELAPSKFFGQNIAQEQIQFHQYIEDYFLKKTSVITQRGDPSRFHYNFKYVRNMPRRYSKQKPFSHNQHPP